MTTKQQLLNLLEEQNGEWLSGEEIARRLSLSRTAIWKGVNALRSDGYEIQGAQNRGYRLSRQTDILSLEGIRKYLKPEYRDREMEVLPIAASTNALLRDKAGTGIPEGYAIIANAQTQGRGRLGRRFYSPPDTGLYLSLLLRPSGCTPEQGVKVTTMAAVAACRAIESLSGRSTQIKWVNDIYMDGRKVGGILTEGVFNLETGSLEHIVLGIGINVYAPREGFPEEISRIAGAVLGEQRSDGKNRLAAEFLNHFLDIYRNGDYAEEYRAKSLVIGRELRVSTPMGERQAVALDVDRDCRLIVRYEDGSVDRLSSAEVSIRTK